MSFASIVLGLLIWFSLPPFYERTLKRKPFFFFKLGCKALGACFIGGGVIAGFF